MNHSAKYPNESPVLPTTFLFSEISKTKITNMWWSTKRLGWSIFNQSKAAYRNIGERKIKMGGQRWLLLITNMGLIHHVISNRWSFLTYYSSFHIQQMIFPHILFIKSIICSDNEEKITLNYFHLKFKNTKWRMNFYLSRRVTFVLYNYFVLHLEKNITSIAMQILL